MNLCLLKTGSFIVLHFCVDPFLWPFRPVDHSMLLHRLPLIQLDTAAQYCSHNYLLDRSQCVKIVQY
uniref:Uncharacterized protein n=1 Tax=Anguilla anguilla TaxID=7936 RepID=A0A0E9RRA8_ANGAN